MTDAPPDTDTKLRPTGWADFGTADLPNHRTHDTARQDMNSWRVLIGSAILWEFLPERLSH